MHRKLRAIRSLLSSFAVIRLHWIAISIIAMSLILLFSAVHFPHSAQAQTSPTQTISKLQLHHITLSVNDVDLVSRWYADYLGFTITDRFTLTRPNGRQIAVARLEIPGLRMNISGFPDSVSPDRSIENQGWRHIAFAVDDVDRNYQLLRSRGVEFIGEPYTYDPPGYRIAFFRDAEGNILELYQDL